MIQVPFRPVSGLWCFFPLYHISPPFLPCTGFSGHTFLPHTGACSHPPGKTVFSQMTEPLEYQRTLHVALVGSASCESGDVLHFGSCFLILALNPSYFQGVTFGIIGKSLILNHWSDEWFSICKKPCRRAARLLGETGIHTAASGPLQTRSARVMPSKYSFVMR